MTPELSPEVRAIAEAQAEADRALLAQLTARDGPLPVRVRRRRPHEGINLAMRTKPKRRRKR